MANLTHAGYRCYFPLARVRRRDRVLRTLLHTVEVPLFPRYAFVLLDGASWAAIGYTPGVSRLLMADGQPQRVSAAVLEAVQAAEAAGREPILESARWSPGTPCKLCAGPFRGASAVVLKVSRGTVQLAVMLLGGLCQLSAPTVWLASREQEE